MSSLISKKAIPSCEYCKHGHIFTSGDGWNEPLEDEFVCDKEDELSEDEIDMAFSTDDASGCSGFEPEMVDKCCECGKELNIPMYQAKYQCRIIGEVAYCSSGCRDKSEKLLEKELGGC